MEKKNYIKKHYSKRLLSFILCIVLTVAMALGTTGCNGGTKSSAGGNGQKADIHADGSVLGEGSSKFDLTVADQNGKETRLEIHTDKEYVGEALTELGVIAGEESEYGLYVKTVNGITADYDKDGKYWAFYINGEYAQAGVDAVEVTDGDSYLFKVE